MNVMNNYGPPDPQGQESLEIFQRYLFHAVPEKVKNFTKKKMANHLNNIHAMEVLTDSQELKVESTILDAKYSIVNSGPLRYGPPSISMDMGMQQETC